MPGYILASAAGFCRAGRMEPLHTTLLFSLRDGSGKGAVKLDSSLLVFSETP